MIFMKCTGVLEDEKVLQLFYDADYRKQRDHQKRIQDCTSKQLMKGNDCFFLAEFEDDIREVSIGAIVDNLDGFEKKLHRFLSSIKIDLINIQYEEVCFEVLDDLLLCADRTYVRNARAIIDNFGLGMMNSSIYKERILERMRKEQLFGRAEKIYIRSTLVPELERIYEGKKAKKVDGHPVQYMIQCDDNDIRNTTIELLHNALYDNGRVGYKRIGYIDILSRRRVFRGINQEDIENLYKSNKGGVIVVDYRVEEETEGNYASEHRYTIEMLSKLMNEYRNSVLTICCLSKECTKVKGWFYEYLGDMSVVELKEEFISGEEARAVLNQKAKNHHIRADKNLTSHIKDDQKYLLRTLDEDFELWFNKKLRCTVYPQYQRIDTVSQKKSKESPKGTAYEELNNMIGLTDAKKVINQALDFYKAQKVFREKGIDQDHPSMHMVFTGNPGTAKTTVARLFADIMKDNGVLSTGKLVEVGRSDLVGKFVGWTAPTVKAKFEDAKGGVLFIDEAYSLVDDRSGLYGDEAINTIVQEMENHREELVVIFAGYPDKMEAFLDKNPGLRSRIAFHIPFMDYSVDELCEISQLIAKKKGMSFRQDALEKLQDVFSVAIEQPDFGNGRYVRNVIEKARMAQSSRLLSKNIDDITKDDILTFCAEDIEIPKIKPSNVVKMGFCS